MAKKKLIATGLTIEKAIQKGLKKIGLPQSQAIIHILQGEESGLFKKTDAAISIIYDEDESHQALIEQVKDELSTQKALLWEEGQVKLKMCPCFLTKRSLKRMKSAFSF